MPTGEVWKIEQGYLPKGSADSVFLEGRIRRITHADGRVECVHTIKQGIGLVREETERSIDRATFDLEWPRTEGRRLEKVRTRIQCGERMWEIDQFTSLPLILAECELPSADTPLALPEWLAPVVDREVTEEPAFRNFALAVEAGIDRGFRNGQ